MEPQWDAESVTDQNDSTHLWIVNQALGILARHQSPTEPRDASTLAYLPMFQSDPCRSLWQQGLYDADWLSIYDNGGTFSDGWKSHFYDPDTGENYKGETSPTALTEAIAHFNNAVEYATHGNWSNPSSSECQNHPAGSGGCVTSACYELGLSLHYMTDATQPMHAANFTGENIPILYHSRYETHVMAIQSGYGCADWDASCDSRALGYPAANPVAADGAATVLHTAAEYAKPLSDLLVSKATTSCWREACCWEPSWTMDLPYWEIAMEANTCWATKNSEYDVGPVTGLALVAAQKSTAQYLWTFFNALAPPAPAPPTPTTLMGGLTPWVAFTADTVNVYYASGSPTQSVWKQPVAGGSPTLLASGQTGVYYLAVDDTAVYWASYDSGVVRKVPIAGGSTVTLAQTQSQPTRIAVDPTNHHVYWTNVGDGSLIGLPGGSGTPVVIASQQSFNSGLAADASGVYWTSRSASPSVGHVTKASLQGTVEPIYDATGTSPTAVAIAPGEVYFTDLVTKDIKRATKSGGTWQVTLVAGNQANAVDIAVGPLAVYWTDAGLGTVVKKEPLNPLSVIATGQSEPRGIAVSLGGVVWANENFNQPGAALKRLADTTTTSLDFGGAFGYVDNGVQVVNPATGALSCPSGYQAHLVLGTTNSDWSIWYCYRPHQPGRDPALDYGGAYGTINSTTTLKNPITNQASCPAGYIDQRVLGTSNVDAPVHVCYKQHTLGQEPEYQFGGMFGWVNAAPTSNPLTGTSACPAGYRTTKLLGTSGLDYELYACVGMGKELDFGGAYGYVDGGAPAVNPATSALSCPSGYQSYQVLGTTNSDWPVWYCYRPHVAGRDPLYDYGGGYGYVDGGVHANNPITGTMSCPSGYIDQRVLDTINVDRAMHVCYRTHSALGTSLRFGGMFGYVDGAPVPDPVTGTFACPSGFARQRLLGTSGTDYDAVSCYDTGSQLSSADP
ncbi:Hypothetical protein A7982_00083 [Minicystis rosea]|nr:Hypothetical protein A7982_00083 [Minicystis rosea]